MKEALRSSETSVPTRVTRRNILDDTILHSHRRENLKSYENRISCTTRTRQRFFISVFLTAAATKTNIRIIQYHTHTLRLPRKQMNVALAAILSICPKAPLKVISNEIYTRHNMSITNTIPTEYSSSNTEPHCGIVNFQRKHALDMNV
jgi:hypothetical protein